MGGRGVGGGGGWFLGCLGFFWQGNCTNHHSRQSGYGPCTRLETVPVKILFYWFYVGLGWLDIAAALTSRTCEMSELIATLLLEGSSPSRFITEDRCLLWNDHEMNYHSEDVNVLQNST